MKLRVVVLGAGFGGLELSTILSEKIGDRLDLTLIDKKESFFFGFSKFDVMFGHKTSEAVKIYYSNIIKPGVKFIRGIPQPDKEITSTEFRIEMQPGLVSFGGEYILMNNDSVPIDLRQVGKTKCSDLTDQIENSHKTSAKNEKDKWNKAFIKLSKTGQVKTEFIWDEELEQGNINAYNRDAELIRQKWYWEEK